MAFLSSSDSDEGLESSLGRVAGGRKSFQDAVHAEMELPELCCRFMNTPQFQRLRNLKQLGLCYFVYPAAAHNRFEHSLGTSYLAGKYCRRLQERQPELGISGVDVLCLELAGLCHDLGHGPFSHTWEHFMKDFVPDYSHEVMSMKLLDYLIQDNDLWPAMEADGLTPNDLLFIKELILGRPLPGYDTFQARPPCKTFLYQLVANEETKVDVDKFDYLLRDARQLHVATAFDYQRLMDNTRVLPVRLGQTTHMKLAYRKKVASTLEDLFKGRLRLHQMAYQHRVIKVIEEMVLDGLRAAEPHFRVTAEDGEMYGLSTAHQDLSAFMKLTDGLLEQVLSWQNGGPEAERIFGSILRRELYQPLGYFTQPPKAAAWAELLSDAPQLHLIPTQFNYGKGAQNPLDSALFFEKQRPDQPVTLRFPAPPQEGKHYVVVRPPAVLSSSGVPLAELRSLLSAWAMSQGLQLQQE